jgi:hypothetical protein
LKGMKIIGGKFRNGAISSLHSYDGNLKKPETQEIPKKDTKKHQQTQDSANGNEKTHKDRSNRKNT